ncbi:MAG: hypothetical protein IT582_00045 [Opitutaceae bacterium]|nr:hypothetical protein [Opitutaceae bacterium]
MNPVAPPLTPTADRRLTAAATPPRLRTGFEAWLHGFAGRRRSRAATADTWLAEGHHLAVQLAQTPPETVAALTAAARAHRAAPSNAHNWQCHTLLLLARIARATTRLTPYAEQLAGARGLADRVVIELATGEGKSLMLALAAAAAAWRGGPVHILTANDYLAQRDAAGFAPFYSACGLRAAAVTADDPAPARRDHYAADGVYLTARECVADHLRDRLAYQQLHDATRRTIQSCLRHHRLEPPHRVQRGLSTVLVDEADSLLIDEAVTPLIISQPRSNPDLEAACVAVTALVRDLAPGRDYRVFRALRQVEITGAALDRLAAAAPHAATTLRNRLWLEELAELALQAREFFHRDQHYLVRDGGVVIVDEATGRTMDQRTWSEGLHQLIEVKEGLPPSPPSVTLSAISFQRFFRRVPRLAGATGTARENAAELWRIYGLAVVPLPTHRPCCRTVATLRVFAAAEAKKEAVVRAALARLRAGQAVLVGTRHVTASEALARDFLDLGHPGSVLNARQPDLEVAIVAQAGTHGTLTIATNMAGRGTDIRLDEATRAAGGLCVVATELHSSARIDRQLYGRCARQGDPGLVLPFAALDDDIPRRFLPGWLRRPLTALVARDWPAAQPLARAALRWARRRADRQATRQRVALLTRDEQLARAFFTRDE